MTKIVEKIIDIVTVIEIATIILVITVAGAIILYFYISKKNKANIKRLNTMCKGASKFLYSDYDKKVWEKFFSQTSKNFNWFTRFASVNHLELKRYYNTYIK